MANKKESSLSKLASLFFDTVSKDQASKPVPLSKNPKAQAFQQAFRRKMGTNGKK